MVTTPTRTDKGPGLLLVAAMSALMWVSEVVDQLSDSLVLDAQGIVPRTSDGLSGVLLAPFLHVGFGHLLSNTVPFLAMGALIALSGVRRLATVTVVVLLVSGIGTWLVAPPSTVHLGASGVVFGYGSYLVLRGLFDRRWYVLLTGLVVALVYGSTLLLGLVPREGISWQTHLFGAVGGLVAARLLARPRRAKGEGPTPG